ncbi:hypothetical protein [Streptomyces reniochalinae]|uniref:hypothetical protein n=1 Tax=Streptomyces reniochalinae TaxID=2250578 RepID=UPI0015F0AE11|nr:hypothetical protein [Streptomyces reniochalinae]
MRVAVMTAGSRGDIAPCTGLAHGLAAGCRLGLVAGADLAIHTEPEDLTPFKTTSR